MKSIWKNIKHQNGLILSIIFAIILTVYLDFTYLRYMFVERLIVNVLIWVVFISIFWILYINKRL
ncbi:MAG: hypothetical protein ABSE83_06365 [Methanobacterium sp.]|jgi:hypothetical protein